jgi:hypothetical protein
MIQSLRFYSYLNSEIFKNRQICVYLIFFFFFYTYSCFLIGKLELYKDYLKKFILKTVVSLASDIHFKQLCEAQILY